MKPSPTRVSAASSSSAASGSRVLVVADHLELDPVGLERLASEARGGDRVARREAAGGVGQHEAARRRRARPAATRARRVDAAHRNRGHLGARGLHGCRHRLEVAKAARADDQARRELRSAISRPGMRSSSLHRLRAPRPGRLRPAACRSHFAARHDLAVERHRHAARRPRARRVARTASATVAPSGSPGLSPLSTTVGIRRAPPSMARRRSALAATTSRGERGQQHAVAAVAGGPAAGPSSSPAPTTGRVVGRARGAARRARRDQLELARRRAAPRRRPRAGGTRRRR